MDYNIEGVSFVSWYGASDSPSYNVIEVIGEQIFSDKGNPLFIGSDNKIYELDNNNLTEYGTLPTISNASRTIRPYYYAQYQNCILTGYTRSGSYLVTYSLDYGKTWNTFDFSAHLPSGVTLSDYVFGYAYLNNSIGILVKTSSNYFGFAYTSDFETVTIGKTFLKQGSFTPYIAGKIDNTIVIHGNYNYAYIMENFGAEVAVSPALPSNTSTSFGYVNTIGSNAIISYINGNQRFYLYLFENGTITKINNDPYVTWTDSNYTSKFVCYRNNYLYILYQTDSSPFKYKLRKIDIIGQENEVELEVQTKTSAELAFSKLINNYIVLGCAGQIYGNETKVFVPIDVDLMQTYLMDQPAEIGEDIITVVNNNKHHFYIYLPTSYTERTLKKINPEERTTIYPNDYSTITGNQILENAVRSVNHKIYVTYINQQDIDSIAFTNFTITQNPAEHYYHNFSYTGIGFNWSEEQRVESYIQQFSNCIITTTEPIISNNINSDNFKISSSNKQWYKNDRRFSNSFVNTLFNAINDNNEPCSINTTELEQTYGVTPVDNYDLLTNNENLPSYKVYNIEKIDNFTVKFDLQIVTKLSYFNVTDQIRLVDGVLGPIAEVDIKVAQSINITLNALSISSQEKEFKYSIDLDNSGNYIQNNPLQRADNELFSLDNTFFETQANAIIQYNKDGRMVLIVNSTSDLGLYIGKELTVTLKDGTLANNGATFEVVGIKEKFTGINWKQTYTLKEKKISV